MKTFAVSKIAGMMLLGLAAGACMAAEPSAEQLEEGKAIFTGKAVPACAVCHTLADAGSTGAIGPNLDELKPDVERIKKVLHEGMGVMPSFANSLDEASMEAVAAYVAHATGAAQ